MGSLEMVIPPVGISWDSAITLDYFRESATKDEKNPNSVDCQDWQNIERLLCRSQRFGLIGSLSR